MVLREKSNIVCYSFIIILMASYGAYMSATIVNVLQLFFSVIILISLLIALYCYKTRRSQNASIFILVITDCVAMVLMLAWIYMYALILFSSLGEDMSWLIYFFITCLILAITAIASYAYYRKMR